MYLSVLLLRVKPSWVNKYKIYSFRTLINMKIWHGTEKSQIPQLLEWLQNRTGINRIQLINYTLHRNTIYISLIYIMSICDASVHASKGPMLCERRDSTELWLLPPRSCWGKQKLSSSGTRVWVGPPAGRKTHRKAWRCGNTLTCRTKENSIWWSLPGCFLSLWVTFLFLHTRKRIIATGMVTQSPRMMKITMTSVAKSKDEWITWKS